jgi:hypothetical protein
MVTGKYIGGLLAATEEGSVNLEVLVVTSRPVVEEHSGKHLVCIQRLSNRRSREDTELERLESDATDVSKPCNDDTLK